MTKVTFGLSIFFIAIISYSASHQPLKFLANLSQDSGRDIVTHYCNNCHAVHPLIELNAPKIASDKDWQPRLKPGWANLMKHTFEGINAMPARGGCFECSDQQLIAAVLYLMPEKLAKKIKKRLQKKQ